MLKERKLWSSSASAYLLLDCLGNAAEVEETAENVMNRSFQICVMVGMGVGICFAAACSCARQLISDINCNRSEIVEKLK